MKDAKCKTLIEELDTLQHFLGSRQVMTLLDDVTGEFCTR